MSEASPGNFCLTRDEAVGMLPGMQVATIKFTKTRLATYLTRHWKGGVQMAPIGSKVPEIIISRTCPGLETIPCVGPSHPMTVRVCTALLRSSLVAGLRLLHVCSKPTLNGCSWRSCSAICARR